MPIKIDPKDATLGATITGIDLAHLDDTSWVIVRQAFLEFGVLIFPEQSLSDDVQIAFASRFGELETPLAAISNERSNGEVVTTTTYRTGYCVGTNAGTLTAPSSHSQPRHPA